MTTMTHHIKRCPRPALSRPVRRAVEAVPAHEPAWREDVRQFFMAYFAGLVAFGLMLA